MATLANLVVQMSANTAALEKGFQRVQSQSTGLGAGLKKVGTIAAGFLSAQVIGGGVQKLTGFLSDCTAKAKEQAAAEAQLGAVLKSTGGAAGVTAEEAKKLAAELQKTTNYGDEATIAAEALLLSFTNISKDVFPDTTKAVLDMSTAMGTGLKETAIQVGKALQDPVLGVTSLQRVGVRLTETQKEQVKTMVEVGDAAGAQALILAELTKEFGGSAEAAVAADGGMTQMSNRMGDMQEKIGTALLPAMVKWKEAQLFVLDSMMKLGPVLRSFSDEWLPRLKAGFDLVKDAAEKVGDAFGPLLNKLKPFVDELQESGAVSAAAAAIIGTTLVAAFIALAVAAGSAAVAVIAATWPFIAIGAAIAGVTAAIVLAIRHWDDIKAAVARARDMFLNASPPIKALAIVLALPLVPIIALGVGIQKLVTGWESAWFAIRQTTATVINTIVGAFAGLMDAIAWVLRGLSDVANKVPSWVPGANKVKDALDDIAGAAEGAAAQLHNFNLNLTGAGRTASAWANFRTTVQGTTKDLSTGLLGAIRTVTGAVGSFYTEAKALVPVLGSGIGAAADAAAGGTGKLAQEVEILTPEMVALNDQIIHEEAHLESIKAALAFAEDQHATFTIGLEDAEAALRSAEDAMHGWESAVLEGTRAYSDMAFGISQESDKLQLAINKIKLGMMTEDLEDGGYASDALSRKIRLLGESLGVAMHGGKMDIEDIEKVLAAAGEQMDILGLKSQNVKLKENLDLGPKKHELDKFFEDAAGYAEYTLPEIKAGYGEAQTAAGKAEDAVKYWNDQLTINELHMSFIQGLLFNHEERLVRIRDKYGEIEQAAKDAWDAAGNVPTTEPGVPAASVESLQHGGYITSPGFVRVHAGEAVVPAAGVSGGGNTYIDVHVQGSILSERDIERIISDAMRHGKFRGMGVLS